MLVRPDTNSQLLRAKLSRALATIATASKPGNDVLYMLLISILGIFGAVIGLACLSPTLVGGACKPLCKHLMKSCRMVFISHVPNIVCIHNNLRGIKAFAALRILPIILPFLESSRDYSLAESLPKCLIIYRYINGFRTRYNGLFLTIFECFCRGRKLRLAPVYIRLQNGQK